MFVFLWQMFFLGSVFDFGRPINLGQKDQNGKSPINSGEMKARVSNYSGLKKQISCRSHGDALLPAVNRHWKTEAGVAILGSSEVK